MITTDGTIGEFSRKDYIEAEEKIALELSSINKPYIIILNTTKPTAKETEKLTEELKLKYKLPVLPIDVLNMNEI